MNRDSSALFTYLKLQGKRIFTILPAVLLVSVLLFASVLVVGHAFFVSDSENDSRRVVKIGIVGSYEDTFLELAVTALQNIDSSRFSMELVRTDEQDAIRRLRSGEMQAYVIIPDGFFEGVDSFRNDVPVTYVSTDGAVGIGTVMINELVETIDSLLLESENAIYGMQTFAQDHYGEKLSGNDISDLGYAMTEKYGIAIFKRDALFEVHETGLADSLTFRGYYFAAVVLLFLLLCALPFATLFSGRDLSLMRLMKLRGVTYFQQVLAEYFAYALTAGALSLIFVPLSYLVLSGNGLKIPELAEGKGGAGFAAGVLCSVFLIAALQFFIYELFSGTVPGILMQVMTALAAAYISGCFYPISYFPEKMRAAANLLPAGTARLLLTNGLLGHFSAALALRALFSILLCLFLAAFYRSKRRK